MSMYLEDIRRHLRDAIIKSFGGLGVGRGPPFSLCGPNTLSCTIRAWDEPSFGGRRAAPADSPPEGTVRRIEK